MEVTVDGQDVDVGAQGAGATFGDLARALGRPAASLGRPPDAPLALRRGEVLPAPPRPDAGAQAVAVLAVVAGPDSGRTWPLHDGVDAIVVGRAGAGPGAGNESGGGDHPTGAPPGRQRCAVADPTVSTPHLLVVATKVPGGIEVRVADLGSRNGTWLAVPAPAPAGEPLPGATARHRARRRGRRRGQGRRPPPAAAAVAAGRAYLDRRPAPVPAGALLHAGASTLAIRAADAGDRPVRGAGSSTSFNRPPRPAPPPPPGPIAVPPPPPERHGTSPLGVMAVVAPLLMAGAMVALLGNPVFALFALLSPVLAVGNHVEGTRRARRTSRRDRGRRAAELADLDACLAAAVDRERRRRLWSSPDPAEIARRAIQPSTRLWERRPHHDDRLALRVGTGDVSWSPPVDDPGGAADVAEHAARHAVLPATPVVADLTGGALGIVAPRPVAVAVARALVVQVAVHHGPADLALAVATDDPAAWTWAKWLPHTEDHRSGARWLAAGREVADAVAAALEPGPGTFVVVDGEGLLDGRRAPVRALLEGSTGVVVAAGADRLPACCSAVVEFDEHGDGELRLPSLGRIQPLHADGMAGDVAERVARALAALDDPELAGGAGPLPATVHLGALVEADAVAVAERWRAAPPDPEPATPIGVAADGVVVVDLVADGPHALVAGTTGSGKSELLRTLVAGLAAANSPDHLTFVLVDFKGGAAFDACAGLPHVVGLVTDLDAGLAERALRCLEAELRRRERRLRAEGAADLAALRAGIAAGDEPLPRLVVVVDEFATLKAELPDFVDRLVGIAQRGRSLGVHLVLATQRPAGAVSDAIRANTDLRIALRVLDERDALDVVDRPDPARLPRSRPGRACLRAEGGEVVVVQTALASAPAGAGREAVAVRPFEPFSPAAPRVEPTTGAPTDLEALVEACRRAWSSLGGRRPRRPWPEPLPDRLPAGDLPAGASALADDPDRQQQAPVSWSPADGVLAVVGPAGSGTTTALLSVLAALLSTHRPDDLHVYAVDHGAGGLGPVADAPHCGAVVAAADRERQRRLVLRLRRELDARRDSGGRRPAIVLAVDGVTGLLAAFDDAAGLEVLAALERVVADGPAVGIHAVLAADRSGALPAAVAAACGTTWTFGGGPPGRFVDGRTGLVAQVALPPAAVRSWPAPARPPEPVGALPAAVPIRDLPPPVVGTDPWALPVGLADDDLAPAALTVWPGDHLLVVGPGRSGRTTALRTIGEVVAAAGIAVEVVAGRRSTLPFPPVAAEGPSGLLLVDDAEGVDDPSGALERLVADPPAGVHVVASARRDALRGLYGHWTRGLRRSRLGLLLQPDLDLDGELLGAALPRRVHVPLVPGRGFLVVDGAATLVQVATAERIDRGRARARIGP